MKFWNKMRRLAAGVCAIIMAAGALGQAGSLEAYGATNSSVVENVTVTLTANYGEAEEIREPTISVGGTDCSLGDYQYGTALDKWRPGKKVRIEITVEAGGGKVFPVSLNSSQCKVTGASFVSARALGDSKLQVKVDYTPVTILGGTTWAGWDKTERKKATWKAVKYATGYSVSLYGDNKVVKRQTVKGTSLDMAPFMKTDDKTYYFEVKAIPTTSEEKKYLKEGIAVASVDDEYDYSENWNDNTDDGGSIRGNNYILPDGEKSRNSWKKVSGRWYYFDENGSMAKGWRFINNYWYFMNSNGAMQTGWISPAANTWFYMNENGEMCTGWVEPKPGDWYYLDGNGYMQRGWANVNGRWYYLDNNGKMQRGWVMISGVWYYFNGDGSMAVNTFIDGWTIGANGAAYQ